MADLPIIFSAPMVCALLAGRKSQTRRLLSLRGYRDFSAFGPSDTPGYSWHFRRADGCWCDVTDQRLYELLPYAVGDRLYVRENWSHSGDGVFEIRQARMLGRGGVIYRADDNPRYPHARYWPSIHMPRELSRLTLTVTDVRVQRLQAISEADALAEGIVEHEATMTDPAEYTIGPDSDLYFSATEAFRALWNSLHGAGAWAENPWVIALTFTVDQRNIDG